MDMFHTCIAYIESIDDLYKYHVNTELVGSLTVTLPLSVRLSASAPLRPLCLCLSASLPLCLSLFHSLCSFRLQKI